MNAQSIPRLVREILRSRGIEDAAAIGKWLAPSLKDLKNPLCLTDMNLAVERLVHAREMQELVCIYADYDLDGTSACALLRDAFERLGFAHVSHYQPSRLREGYGLRDAALRKIAAEGVTLIVTVDLGITAVAEAVVAREIGVDLIITDHHLPKETLPDAYAVINPNRGNCSSGLGHLCGTGVAFYLALALKSALLERGIIAEGFDPKELLDCFAIGTLTDMVPLIDENRSLTKHGLLALARTKRPGLRALLQALKLWGIPLTAQDVAIRFAPKLNALTRLELGILPLDLYLVKDPGEAERMVAEVLASNQTRISLQRQAESEAIIELEARPPRGCAVVASAAFHRGIVGLVATKTSQAHGVPSFIGATEGEIIVGSARAPEGAGINLLDAMQSVGSVLTRFGGHTVAAGFELEVANFETFRIGLERYFQDVASLVAQTWIWDAECELSELTPNFMSWFEALAPFGAGFAMPSLLLKNARLEQKRELTGGHLRLLLSDDSRSENATQTAAIWFSPGDTHPALIGGDFAAGAQLEALVEPQWNWFQGKRTLQLLVRNLRVKDKC